MSLLTLDLRSLGLFRIGVALLLLWDLGDRARDLTDFYTDVGVLPRGMLVESYWNPAWWSLHLFSGQPAGQGFLFAIHALAGLALLLGYRTRWAALACYLLTLSLHNRNPLVLDSGDRLFLLLQFWGLFLPWEGRWSLDARRDARLRACPNAIVSVGGTCYLLQVATVYFMAAFWKLHPAWITDRTALWRALELFQFTKPLGHWLLQYPTVMSWLTLGTFMIEWIAPVLLLTGNGRLRLAGLVLLTSLHLGIALTMDLEFFPLVSLTALLGLLPSLVWKRALAPDGSGQAQSSFPWAYHPATQGLAGLALLGVMTWNTSMLAHGGGPDPSPGFGRSPWVMALNATRLVQFWNLFSPVPRPVDSRYFVEARLENGTSIDLLRGGRKLSSSPVPYPYREFKNQHQRNYLNALEWSLNNPFAHRYLRRLAVDWEQRHPDQKILWTRLLSMRRESRFLDPGRPRKLVEVAWAIPPNSRWQGPLLMPYAETQPLAGVRTDDEGSSKI